ncbi:unnamed protein product, partial [Prorocentrum cordatum]
HRGAVGLGLGPRRPPGLQHRPRRADGGVPGHGHGRERDAERHGDSGHHRQAGRRVALRRGAGADARRRARELRRRDRLQRLQIRRDELAQGLPCARGARLVERRVVAGPGRPAAGEHARQRHAG